MNSVLSSNTT